MQYKIFLQKLKTFSKKYNYDLEQNYQSKLRVGQVIKNNVVKRNILPAFFAKGNKSNITTNDIGDLYFRLGKEGFDFQSFIAQPVNNTVKNNSVGYVIIFPFN